MDRFEELVRSVVARMRDVTPRETVELGVIHGFCLDEAESQAPSLVAFLSSVGGLDAVAAQLSRLPDYIVADDIDGSRWQFVQP